MKLPHHHRGVCRLAATALLAGLCLACGPKGNAPAGDKEARREALKEFRAMAKELDKMQQLAPSVQYRVLRQGDGPVPTDTSLVTVHYEGRLQKGRIFDSTYERGKPWTTRVDSCISGWRSVLTHMPCGSKWFVLIGFDKAYGDESVAGIPPMSDLYFTMELLDVK